MVTYQVYKPTNNLVTNNGLSKQEAVAILKKNQDLKVAYLSEDGWYRDAATQDKVHLKFPH